MIYKEFKGYHIYENGVILNSRGLQMKYQINERGYCIIKIGRKNYRVHRIVALVFKGQCRPGYQVNHIDGIKINNANDNLEYISKSKNQLHRRHTLQKHGSTKSLKILAKKDGFDECFSSINSAHKSLSISYSCIKQCCEGIRKTAGGYTFSYN